MKNLIFERERRSHRSRRARSGRFASALLLLLFLPVAASAYTLVMRSGRRLEIPSNFTVTSTVLTYEAAPGISVTLQLSGVDIPATERINNEAAGSFLRRASDGPNRREASRENDLPAQGTGSARRTITNRELEDVRRARRESEEAYERRAQELGLPSQEEERRRREEEAQRLRELSRLSEEEQEQAESYWRARAGELRTEITVVDAQINYLRDQLGNSPRTLTAGSYSVLTVTQPVFPFRQRGGPGHVFPRPFFPRPVGPIGAGVAGPPRPGRAIGVGGGTTTGQVVIRHPGPSRNDFGRNNFGRPPAFFSPGLIVPPLGHFVASYPVYDSSYERTIMVTRLRELEAVREGLAARWRLLEDEARRAGAMPGWLRP
ncbi:MAG TPA: hypothetical protein VE842_09525 [Pyrinomonadaceae bacterium]|jgi:hypothetical protein|nr:hypothetical protein [Pyrinomonadaceae bacterium]